MFNLKSWFSSLFTKKRKKRVILTDKQREELIEDYRTFGDIRILAKLYNVSYSTACKIIRQNKKEENEKSSLSIETI